MPNTPPRALASRKSLIAGGGGRAVVELRRVRFRGLSHDVLAFPISDQAPVVSNTGPSLPAIPQAHSDRPMHSARLGRAGKLWSACPAAGYPHLAGSPLA